MIEAFEHVVLPAVPEAVLQVVGGGPDHVLVEALADRHPHSVIDQGAGNSEHVASALRATTVFTTAPWAQRRWNEQYGLAYLEAMACGVPVVTTISGTNHEAVQPPNLRVPHDAEALGEGLLAFLTDPVRQAEVGAQNRETVCRDHDMITQCVRMGEVFTRFERT